ncbi:unnamed protein product [Closterium sp. Yama58-4]|nr:unnamed protein product [Closterium sp. Yama58-4]
MYVDSLLLCAHAEEDDSSMPCDNRPPHLTPCTTSVVDSEGADRVRLDVGGGAGDGNASEQGCPTLDPNRPMAQQMCRKRPRGWQYPPNRDNFPADMVCFLDPRPGHGTFYRCLDGENGLWSVIINQAKVNMEGVRASMALRSDPAHILSVDGRWSQVREAKHCTVSFMDPVSRKVAFYKNTHRDVDDDTSVKLERVGFDQGMDELREIGFGVAGIVTDGGSSFKTAVRERGLKHQEDWWHKCGTLVRSFKTDVQDATRKAGEVGAATSCEDLYLITINKLLGWLREHPRPGTTFGRGSGKKALVEAVCAARGLEFKDMDPADAKWLHLELQQVLQTEVGQPTVRASTEVVEEAEPGVTVGHGPRDGSEGPNGDGLNGGVGAVEVQWPDVDEMWGWDAHPEHGIRPSSHASMVLVQAWRGLEHNTASLYDGTVGQDEQENVPASGGAAGIATEGGMDNDAAEQRPRRWGRRAPRRRTRQGDGGGAGSESESGYCCGSARCALLPLHGSERGVRSGRAHSHTPGSVRGVVSRTRPLGWASFAMLEERNACTKMCDRKLG